MKYLLFVLIISGICSCNNKPASQLDKSRLEQLAVRSCRAKTIRKQRFILADKIRFTQDSLAKTKNAADAKRFQSKLTDYLKQKSVLLKASLSLADTIRMQMDSLVPYTDKAAQKRFTASFDSILKAKGCNR